ncbi:transcriptional regulator [Lacrimispora indolis]|uniref:transcriptional regulator n=1 Tax=Lacrimispora indolis TaxID=69825 RepID=UPI0004160E5C|nr:helix-turn-helix transcriptional regulator [[Clostridium] methoxybenzovorans]
MYDIYCKLRDSKGYKDATVAKATGITKSTFSDWKYGRSTPKQEKLQKIADFFGVTVDYLMGSDSDITSLHQTSGDLTFKPDFDGESNSQMNTTEYYIRNLKGLINHNSEMTFKYYSVLCRNERINKDITERNLAQTSKVPLDKYLNFEINHAKLEPDELLQILTVLDIDPSRSIGYLKGSYAAMIESQEDRKKFIDSTFDGSESIKKAVLNFLTLDKDELVIVFQELQKFILLKGDYVSSKNKKFEIALKDTLINSTSNDLDPVAMDNSFPKTPEEFEKKYPPVDKNSKEVQDWIAKMHPTPKH